MTRLLIAEGEIIDMNGRQRADVFVDDGRIAAVAVGLAESLGAETMASVQVLDARGCVVTPGFVDLHTHLREPGREEAETIETGARAAVLGGYSAVVAMPNTDPAQDSVAVVDFVRAQGRRAELAEVFPSGCITVGRAGRQLAPFFELSEAGVHLFTDDGTGVQDPLLMRRAFEYARDLGVLLAQHCEVEALTAGAVMHEGSCCSRLGLPGWPALAEELMVHRDIELVRLTGAPVHLLHLSTARSVELVRRAKHDGLPVTAEVTPHHLSLTDEELIGFDARFKVNPPLRTPADIAALREGLRDMTIDAIATDHAPHTSESKMLPLDQAPPGMLGLETSLGVALATLDLPLEQILAALSWKPAAIAGIADRHGRPVSAGEPANLTVIDPEPIWRVDPTRLASKSSNTPYVERDLRGRIRHTVVAGRPVVVDGRGIWTSRERG